MNPTFPGGHQTSVPDLQVLLVGHTPPPHNGMSAATGPLLYVRGVDVRLLDMGDSRPLVSTGRWGVSNIYDALASIARMLRCRPWRADVAHVPIAQNTPAVLRDAALLVILRICRVPYLVHLHGGYFDQWYELSNPLMRAIARATIGRAARGIVLSSALLHCLECVLPEARISICENGTEPPAKPSMAVRKAGEITVLHLGALKAAKGTVDLIEAASSLDGVRLALAGEAWPEVEVAAHHAGVRLMEPVSGAAKGSLFRDADVMCLPTKYQFEGQPIALLEGMAAGLPIVTTRRAGIEETVGDAAIYVPEGDTQALADALATLRDDPALRARLGARGRARYEERFTAEAYRARVAAIWRDVAASGRGKT